MDCIITCLSKKSSTHNFIVDGRNYFFKGGSSKTVDVSVGRVLQNIKEPGTGNPLFEVKNVKEPEPIVTIPFEEPVDIEAVPFTPISFEEPAEEKVEPAPVVNSMITKVTKPKRVSRKKQAKLVND